MLLRAQVKWRCHCQRKGKRNEVDYATSMLDRQTQNEEIIVAHRCLNAGFGAHAYLLKDPKDFLSFVDL